MMPAAAHTSAELSSLPALQPAGRRARRLLYGGTTALIALAFLSGGIACLSGVESNLRGIAALGYPAYFAALLGLWKLAGGLFVALPRFRLANEWAYAGIGFDLTAAAYSHAAVGDPAVKIVVPLALLAIAGLSRALRDA